MQYAVSAVFAICDLVSIFITGNDINYFILLRYFFAEQACDKFCNKIICGIENLLLSSIFDVFRH
jgi:hypothetical protein